jgi:hypothetical protein
MTYPTWLTWKVVLGLWALAIVLLWCDWAWFRHLDDVLRMSGTTACARVGSTPFAYGLGAEDTVMCAGGTWLLLRDGSRVAAKS